MTLVSTFKKSGRKLKQHYTKQIKNGAKTSADLWFCDNYYGIISRLKAAVNFLSHNGERGFRSLFLFCLEFTAKEKNITSEKIIAKLSSIKPTLKECGALGYMLAAAVCVNISENLSDETAVIEYVKCLHKIKDIDFESIIAQICSAERYLCDDPAEIYEKMSQKTKELYRKAVIRLSEKTGKSEVDCVKEALMSAEKNEQNHIGFYLPILNNKKTAGICFIFFEWIFALSLSCFLGLYINGNWYAPILLIFPIYAVLKPLYDYIASKIFKPYILPSLSEQAEISGDTLITVSALLPAATETKKLFTHLSNIYSSNTLKNVKLMLLLDMKNSKTPETDTDERDISAVEDLIDRLNKKYGGGFMFACRDRVYSTGEKEYTGFERKRGAVFTLIKYLKEGKNGFSVLYGDIDNLDKMKYILALDSDTQLSFEVIRGLLSTAKHPLNSPTFSNIEKRVVSGYGIFVPRIETSISSSEKTVFSRLFTDGGGVSYAEGVSERYMDMFGESIFSGKGLIDIESFYRINADKFDTERILSHDILEGAVLKTAFCGGYEFTDSFPANAKNYYSRLHRWARGDIQNLKYIISPLGKKGACPKVSPIGKYQLFDNFRRVITPLLLFVLLYASCFAPLFSKIMFLITAFLGITADSLFCVIKKIAHGGISAFISMYFSSDISSLQKDILKIGASMGSLPFLAFINTDALIKALYRSIFSKKKLMQWTPSEISLSGFNINIIISAVISIISAVAFVLFGTYFHRFFALLFLVFLPFAFSKGIPIKKKFNKPLSENEARIITSFASASWRFFEENVNADENYLPPDNFQETPIPKKAKRTSPTNIGFYLVSILAAADLSFISAEKMVAKIKNTITSVENLPKYNGLLYNWYDTVKLTPLSPRYISYVDCGNFLCCLTALKEGLYDYIQDSAEVQELIQRINIIIEKSDLSCLYDNSRRLFRIGFDCDKNEKSDSFYDLYSSEARLTSYYECAKRHVPISHWQSLDRSIKRTKGYAAAVSWSGTLFEYFMPSLFLETVENSFEYEILKVCLYSQRINAIKNNIPYGVSESGYYAVDRQLNYKYKAHGIKNLALKRDAFDEKVVSPYSVFLTLPFDRKHAMKNLSKLSSLHCFGRCGFYEAVDFENSRIGGEEYAIVRSYMSHHVGMSIIAIANTLLDNIFVKRFMSDEKMKSAKSLLREKLPDHPSVLIIPFVSNKEKKRLYELEKISRQAVKHGEETYAYSNGDITVFCDKFGRNRCIFGGREMYKYTKRSRGISVGVEINGEIIPIFPDFDLCVSLEKYAMCKNVFIQGLDIKTALCVHPAANGLLCPVKITNTLSKSAEIKIHWYFEPSVLPFEKDDMHSSYSDMFLNAYYNKKSSSIIFTRKEEESTPAISIGFATKHSLSFNLDREKILERKKDAKSVFDRYNNWQSSDIRGVYPACAVSTTITIPPRKSEEVVPVLAIGSNENDAIRCYDKIKSSVLPDIRRGAAALFLRDPLVFSFACNFIACAFFSGTKNKLSYTAAKELKKGISSLWAIGISGDIPIITVFADKNCPERLKLAFIKLHERLKNSSVATDLVFIINESKDYSASSERVIKKLIKENECEDFIDSFSGIHIIYSDEIPYESKKALFAFSSAIYPDSGFKSIVHADFEPVLKKSLPCSNEKNSFCKNGYIINHHPDIPWSHTLSNNCFGTLLTDKSLGYTWSLNSRQNKISPWSNDISCDLYGERLFLIIEESLYDLTDNSSVGFFSDKAIYSSINAAVKSDVTVEVDKKAMKKKISVSLKNRGHAFLKCKLLYCVFPVLHEKEYGDEFIKIQKETSCIFLQNPLNEDYKGTAMLYSFDLSAATIDNLSEVFNFDKQTAGVIKEFLLAPDEVIDIDFYMLFAKDKSAAKKLSLLPFVTQEKNEAVFDTGNEVLNKFSSALLYHQLKSARISARTGFYQVSGAWGFRDQLQDVIPLVKRDKKRALQIIYRMASAQFSAGDVLHWYHIFYKEGLCYKGVRTKCSDDLLWLPFVSAYVYRITGETDFLFKKIPFLQGAQLKQNEKENYDEYHHGEEKTSLLDHCLRAIEKAYRLGEHSLMLMGTGDWNDSFSAVGEKGRGESVWLSMFMRRVCLDFSEVCSAAGNKKMSGLLTEKAVLLAKAIDEYAWNGSWYIRGFYDNQKALGDKNSDACNIDLLVQSWSVLSDMPIIARRKQALREAYIRLFDEKNGIVKLFTPAFNEKSERTGYVNFYPEGMRENGGQYTHAAVWFAVALKKQGFEKEAQNVINALNPAEKYEAGLDKVYKTEPYALCGDVYSAKDHLGRGGWSLYTGSAGWFISFLDGAFNE